MDVQIALAPELGLSPAQFAAAWNDNPRCRAAAEAAAMQAKGAAFDPTAAIVILSVLSGIAGGVAGNALYDLIKEALFPHGGRKQIRIAQHTQADGTPVLIVTIEE